MTPATILTMAFVVLAQAKGSKPSDLGPVDVRCGGYCLYISLRALDLPVPRYPDLEAELGPPSRIGYSMDQLANVAGRHGASVEGVETDLENLARRDQRLACIALLDEGHFVNIAAIADGRVQIIDPPRTYTVSAAAFDQLWSGKALLLADRPIRAPRGLFWRRAAIVAAWIACFAIIATIGVVGVRRARQQRRLALLAIGLSVATSIGCQSRATAPTPLPRVTVTPTTLDLGTVTIGEQSEFAGWVIVENRGTAPLGIHGSDSTCGCTVASPLRSTLPPGDQDVLDILVDVGLEAGQRSSTVTLFTADPANPRVEIPIRWTVRALVEADPPEIDFGAIRPSDRVEKVIRLRVDPKIAERELEAVPSSDRFTAVWVDGAIPGEGRTLQLRIEPNAESGDHRAYIALKSPGGVDRLSIPVRWRVEPTVVAAPAALFSGAVAPGSTLTHSVTVRPADGGPITIQSLTLDGPDPPAFESRAEPRPEDSIAYLTLTAPTRPGVHQLSVLVLTDRADAGVLRIPWTLIVRDPSEDAP